MEKVQIDNIEYSLNEIEKDCWLRMLNGAVRYKDPFHNPVVANVHQEGVNIRTVVLRKVDTEKKQLVFHTDSRSGKWDDLLKHNMVSWLLYNPQGRIQIRLSGNATLHQNDAVADEAWQQSTMGSRKIYLGKYGPSSKTIIPVSGLPAQFEKADPLPEESEAGRKNFGIVITQVKWMEWLWLSSGGHRRASFLYNVDNGFEASWLIP